jgi:hypothetical protein
VQFAQFNAFVPITTPMGREWMERWIGRDWARFVDATRARTIETTDWTEKKVSSYRRVGGGGEGATTARFDRATTTRGDGG